MICHSILLFHMKINNNILDKEYFNNNYEINIKESKLKYKFSELSLSNTNSNLTFNGIKQ